MNIHIEQVTKHYEKRNVLDGITIEVEAGQFVALLGPSGCGKTTLLNALAGLIDIDGGEIQLDGVTLSSPGYTLAPERRRLGMVFQDFALWPHMTVHENVAFGLKLKRFSKEVIRHRVAEVLGLVQMKGYENYLPHQLSGGQKQRIAIARALAPNPSVLLMDEPLSSLDAKLREQMRWQLMEMIRDTGVTTIYVTHDQVEALTMADHVVLLNQGRVEQVGVPTELYQLPKTEFCANFLGSSNLLRGRILSHMGQWATVDCNGFIGKALVHDDSLSHDVVWMIRPSDILITPDLRLSDSGTSVAAVVVARAFQGDTWQYRVVAVEGDGARTMLEVWNPSTLQIGDKVNLWIAKESGILIRPSQSPQLV